MAADRISIDMILASYATGEPIFAFAVTERGAGEIIGSCGFAPMDDGDAVQLYCAFFPGHWGKGYATEAGRRMIEYILSLRRWDTVVIDSSPENPVSGWVAERLGMRSVGPVEQEGHQSRRYVLKRT